MKSACDLPTWKTIKLGTYPKNREELIDEISKIELEHGCPPEKLKVLYGNDYLKQAIFKYKSTEIEEEVDLVLITAEDMGLTPEHLFIGNICNRAQMMGLRLCSTEVGPKLLLQSREELEKELGGSEEYILIGMKAMEGIMNSEIFGIKLTGHHAKLTTILAYSYFKYSVHRKWVFIKSRMQK